LIPHSQFTDFEIKVPWGHISCRWYGNRSVRPILALHAMLDNIGSYARLVPLLPAHVGVLCIEHPGHGRSTPYPPGIQYSLFSWLSVIRRVVLHFQWPCVSLMGHSVAALACNLYAAFYPEDHVDLLIAIESLTIRYKSNSDCIKYFAYSVESMLKPAPSKQKLYTEQQLENVRWGPAPSVRSEHCKPLVERCIRAAPEQPGKFYIAQDRRIVHLSCFTNSAPFIWAINSRISNIPYLLLKASDSYYVNATQVPTLKILRKQNPKFEYHLVQGDHHVLINDPQQLAEHIVPFINKHRPADRWED
ncbi:hypothetical protein KR222_002584, partial [Zaprionus bogoriensis]